jgi:trehalose/maltose hydrolase-like predicted phosphorylase
LLRELEEGSKQRYAGTYLAGIYNRKEGQPSELVNAPNPIDVEINVDGKRLSLVNMQVIEQYILPRLNSNLGLL